MFLVDSVCCCFFGSRSGVLRMQKLRTVNPPGGSPGLGCTTMSQTDPTPRLHMLGVNWRPWNLKLKLMLSQKVGWMEEVITPCGTSVHLGWGVARDWRTFCHVGSKSIGTLSCNPALGYQGFPLCMPGVGIQPCMTCFAHFQGLDQPTNFCLPSSFYFVFSKTNSNKDGDKSGTVGKTSNWIIHEYMPMQCPPLFRNQKLMWGINTAVPMNAVHKTWTIRVPVRARLCSDPHTTLQTPWTPVTGLGVGSHVLSHDLPNCP